MIYLVVGCLGGWEDSRDILPMAAIGDELELELEDTKDSHQVATEEELDVDRDYSAYDSAVAGSI